jgi:hypothetical protein
MPTTLTAAVPHCVTKDDVYNGYIIPEGAIIMMNVCECFSLMSPLSALNSVLNSH